MTNSELTLLGLVADGPRYGHEIEALVTDRNLRAWLAIGLSSIYYVLERLERQQMLTVERSTETSAPQWRFTITEAGQGVLQTAVADLLGQLPALGSGFELGLANLHVLGPALVYRALLHRQALLADRLQDITSDNTTDYNAADYQRALYSHARMVLQAEHDWLTGFLDDWALRYPVVTAGPKSQKSDMQQLQVLRRPVIPPEE